MTRIQRVQTAISHKEPDKVPKGELGIDNSLADRLLGKQLAGHEREVAVRNFLHMDLVNFGDWPSDDLGLDENGNRIFRGQYGEESVDSGKSRALRKPSIASPNEAGQFPVPDIRRVTGDEVAWWKDHTDFFVMAQVGGPVSIGADVMGMENYMEWCMTDTAQMEIVSRKITEFEVEKARVLLNRGAHAILIGDDIAFNQGPFLPPRIMQKLAYPFYKQAIAAIKKHREVPVFLHTDGNLNTCLGSIADCGFDGIQSLQPSAGMDIAKVKKEFGSRLCLMGNIDLDWVMTFAKPEEVAEVVRKTIDIAAPGGGFILSTCNVLIDAIPAANALAMYETAEKYRS